ncbi:MAG: polysaccharide deacetylase family protein [Mycobacteriales bacterium]
MDRRQLLRRTGVVAVAAGVGAAGAVGIEEFGIRAGDPGWAVGSQRPAQLWGTLTVWRARTELPIAALTFDDGPDPRYTPRILKTLERADAPSTFFMVGKNVAEHPELARRVAGAHEIGNHSYSHPDMSRASAPTAREQLGRTHEVIERITKHPPIAFRPPYGRFSAATQMIAAGMNYDMILWSDRLDSRATPSSNVDRLGAGVKAGSIVLAHDGGTLPNQTVCTALGPLLERLKERGIRLVGLTELLTTVGAEAAAISQK